MTLTCPHCGRSNFHTQHRLQSHGEKCREKIRRSDARAVAGRGPSSYAMKAERRRTGGSESWAADVRRRGYSGARKKGAKKARNLKVPGEKKGGNNGLRKRAVTLFLRKYPGAHIDGASEHASVHGLVWVVTSTDGRRAEFSEKEVVASFREGAVPKGQRSLKTVKAAIDKAGGPNHALARGLITQAEYDRAFDDEHEEEGEAIVPHPRSCRCKLCTRRKKRALRFERAMGMS